MKQPRLAVAGQDYPGTWRQFLSAFPDEAACSRYLEGLRWPSGFACPGCGISAAPYRASRARMMCARCGRQASVRAGTMFDKTRTPLRVWFAAAWYLTNEKYGISARRLQRLLGLGSYQTAWTLLHRLRRAMVQSDCEQLQGMVQVDEILVQRNLLLVMAVEVLEPSRCGRIRLKRIANASQEYVQPFVEACVEPSALVETDGSQLYSFLLRSNYRHRGAVGHGVSSRSLTTLTAAKRVASLLKRWVLATHERAVQPAHLDHCLDEFVFRFNRRAPRSRGLLFYRLLQQGVCNAMR